MRVRLSGAGIPAVRVLQPVAWADVAQANLRGPATHSNFGQRQRLCLARLIAPPGESGAFSVNKRREAAAVTAVLLRLNFDDVRGHIREQHAAEGPDRRGPCPVQLNP